jgi:hypothetical protein
VSSENLVGLLTVIFCNQKVQVDGVTNCIIKTGFRGVAGNKGAVVYSMNVFSTRVCVVNAHFAAHKENVKQRNEDFATICAKARL